MDFQIPGQAMGEMVTGVVRVFNHANGKFLVSLSLLLLLFHWFSHTDMMGEWVGGKERAITDICQAFVEIQGITKGSAVCVIIIEFL